MKFANFLPVSLLLLAATPVVWVSGCSGGSSESTTPRTSSLGTAPISFSNGQSGTLSLTHTGSSASGQLTILSSSGLTAPTTSPLPTGTFEVSGQYSYGQRFRVISETVPGFGPISISGTFPTTLSGGNYTLTVEGKANQGVFPSLPPIMATPPEPEPTDPEPTETETPTPEP